jgi:hypothetical protein
MKFAIKRFFLVYLATYFLVGNLGISFTQSTCLFTGNKKYSFDKAVSCCSKNTKAQISSSNASSLSRAKCCSYDRYALKFNFDQSDHKFHSHDLVGAILALNSFEINRLNHIFIGQKSIGDHSNHSPPPPLSTRLATLQVYQI